MLTVEEAREIVKKKPFPKVTKESIEARIDKTEYLTHENNLTICIITMVNGFMVNGQSAPADARNYDAEVGKTYAYDNAFKQLWVLEGYLLRERLYQEKLSHVEKGLQ